MPQVNIATATAPADFPAGTALGKMRFRLNQGSLIVGSLDVSMPLPPVATFQNVAVGTYMLTIQRLTTGSQPTGPSYTTTVVVEAPAPVVGDAPVGADVTIG